MVDVPEAKSLGTGEHPRSEPSMLTGLIKLPSELRQMIWRQIIRDTGCFDIYHYSRGKEPVLQTRHDTLSATSRSPPTPPFSQVRAYYDNAYQGDDGSTALMTAAATAAAALKKRIDDALSLLDSIATLFRNDITSARQREAFHVFHVQVGDTALAIPKLPDGKPSFSFRSKVRLLYHLPAQWRSEDEAREQLDLINTLAKEVPMGIELQLDIRVDFHYSGPAGSISDVKGGSNLLHIPSDLKLPRFRELALTLYCREKQQNPTSVTTAHLHNWILESFPAIHTFDYFAFWRSEASLRRHDFLAFAMAFRRALQAHPTLEKIAIRAFENALRPDASGGCWIAFLRLYAS